MIYILKIILCSSLLIALYFVFLEKEKMYRFNRFYLLFSVILSYTVPFITVTSEHPKPTGKVQTALEATTQVLDLTQHYERFNWISFIWILYGIITVILLMKTIYSIVKIKKIKGKEIWYENQKVVLTDENIPAFSFWKTIYIGKIYLVNNKIDPRIFLHEKSHIDQKHSIDLLFIEVLKIFTWFNPSLYLYKKAVVINHEFLADESVLDKKFNVKDYQHLILDEIISQKNYNLTHTFNFNNTKKRFIMMNAKKSKLANFKKIAIAPVLLLAFGLFVQKTYANPIEKIIEETQNKTSEVLKKSLSEDTGKVFDESENKFLNQQIETQGTQIENTNSSRTVQDTVRPKEGKNTNLKEEIAARNTETATPKDDVTSLPQYPGGFNALRTKISKLFDPSKLNTDKSKKFNRTELTYTVDETGNVIDVDATGNDEIFNTEAISALKKANENVVWIPAEKDGKPVRYRMKIPLAMSFQ
ncbi:M56 family metallopeptidase [Chryseobacterium taeanense]|uniref:M56 family metallopeptidase n=1 Tax=Chryseobacterium taeanense TaxID=311334 RepID=UPI000B7F5870|nr:M56 family metallopeptidase [Chryseobacterium taeanense]